MQKKIYTKAGILLFSLLFAFNENIYAQSEIGVKGGATYFGLNNKINSTVFDFEMRSGLQFGIYYKMHNLLGPIGLQTEFLFQQKGGNFYIRQHENGYPEFGYDNPGSGYWIRRPQRYNYFSIPILLTVTPLKFLDIYAGPEIGYLFDSNAKPTDWETNRFSAGVSAGAAFKIDKNTKLDIRYSKDLTRIADFGDTDIKNYGWAFTIQRALLFRKQK